MPRRSIALFPYRATDPRFLLVKRTGARGGHWQPVTGRVEEADGLIGSRARYRDVIAGCRRAAGAADVSEREDLLVAALREMEEETGVADVLTVVDLGLETRFVGLDGETYHERAFAAEVPEEVPIMLSKEHDDARWCTFDEAMELLHYPENKDALQLLLGFIDAEPKPETGLPWDPKDKRE